MEKERRDRYRWLLSYIGKYRRFVALFIMFGAFAAAINVILAKMLLYVVDHVLPKNDVRLLLTIVLLLTGLYLASILTERWKNIASVHFEELSLQDVNIGLLDHLRRLGMPYVERQSQGDTLALLHTDTRSIQEIYQEYFPEIVYLSVSLLVYSTMLLSISPWLCLLFIPCFLIYGRIAPRFGILAAELHADMQMSHKELNKKIYEAISSVTELRAYAAERWQLKQLAEHAGNHHRIVVDQHKFYLIRGLVGSYSSHLGMLILIVSAIFLINENELSLGGFSAFLFMYTRVMSILIGLQNLWDAQEVSMNYTDRIYRFFLQTPKIREHELPHRLGTIRGEIHFSNIRFGYREGEEVLKGINLHIRPGEKVAVVGESGSGKSTLLKLAGRLYDPDEGEVSLDGIPLTRLAMRDVRRGIGFVFQDTYLFGSSVEDNIRFGNPNASFKQVIEAAEIASAHAFIEALPEGYSTVVGERGIKLSGGQKQRISIARAALYKSPVLILDEATSALDNISERNVKVEFDRFWRDCTVIAVAHRVSTVRDYDRIVVMSQGEIVEEGSFEQLIERQGPFFRLLKGEGEDSDNE